MAGHILLPLLIAMLMPSSAAQLIGCEDLLCPANPNNTMLANCQLGNITAEHIGFTLLTTSINPDPLTWTIGQAYNRSISNISITRNFYLGQSIIYNIQPQSTPPDCAIFFHGISPSLKFLSTSGFGRGRDSGTCADALTLPCTAALQNQVIEALTANATLDCSSVAAMLQSAAPRSCPVESGNWGEVSGKSILGVDAPAPLSITSCHPTIESGYSLTYVDGVSSSPLQYASTAATDFELGITPILTILRDPSTSKAETHLTCMKIIANEDNIANELSSGSRSIAPNLVLGYSALLVLSTLVFL